MWPRRGAEREQGALSRSAPLRQPSLPCGQRHGDLGVAPLAQKAQPDRLARPPPVEGRAQYLGGWRLCGDIGGSGGALLVAAVAAAAPLAAACVLMGAGAAIGTVWVGYFTRRPLAPASRAKRSWAIRKS